MDKLFTYDVVAQDEHTHARAGVFHTAHGPIETPVFMPVGTKGAVKGITMPQLESLGTQIILGNTYHLSQRPGPDIIAEAGGLHAFNNWNKPILTDSGGFQVFSLFDTVKLSDEGVAFTTIREYGGQKVFWTPEINMDIQQKIGADIVMQLDQCPAYPSPRDFVERAVDYTTKWAERCYKAHTREDQTLFAIVQGGMHMDLRLKSLHELQEVGDFSGFGIGGYSVGEPHELMFETLEPLVSEHMPKNKPRYLMGVGNPTTLVRAVAAGVDMFDCVLPTRTGRTGTAFSSKGRMNLRNAHYKRDFGPLDPQCACEVCKNYSRAYLHHLIGQKEMVGFTLVSMHNVYYLINLMKEAREAILAHSYKEFVEKWMSSEAAADY
ncbi:MAG: tRNA guanosine(34) transglycosylase Tgt [Coriobacteriia bacterium]|nr:tRNA guanosine(34) transglycosylase Tgt [Coriobacteriia bacterium]